MQYREEANNEIMILDGQCIRRVCPEKGQTTPDLVCEVIDKEGVDAFDFCVFDGMRQSKQICEDISKAIVGGVGTKTKVIKITSLEFDIKGGDGSGRINGIDSFFVVNS